MSCLPGMPGFVGSTPAYAFHNTPFFSTTNTDQYTDSNVSLGPPRQDRRVIVAIAAASGSSARTILSVTVGGIPLDEDRFSRNTGNSENGHVAIYSGIIPNAASADVVVTWSAAMLSTMFGVYTAVGMINNALFHSDSGGSSAQPFAINVPAKGFVVGCGIHITSGSPSWSGISQNGVTGSEADRRHSIASLGPLNAETGRSISAGAGGTPSRFAVASYG